MNRNSPKKLETKVSGESTTYLQKQLMPITEYNP